MRGLCDLHQAIQRNVPTDMGKGFGDGNLKDPGSCDELLSPRYLNLKRIRAKGRSSDYLFDLVEPAIPYPTISGHWYVPMYSPIELYPRSCVASFS